LIVGAREGEMEGFFYQDVIGAFKDNIGLYSLRIGRTINIECPLVFGGDMLERLCKKCHHGKCKG